MSSAIADPAYEPFRRHDRYGTAAANPQPLSEQLLLAALSITVLPLKVMGAFGCLLWFYAFCRVSVFFPRKYRDTAVASAGKLACRACLFCLGFTRVKWERVGRGHRGNAGSPFVIVSNHCSWVDILIHMSKFFPAFVARDSTKDLLLVGLISKKMGCLFVDRERKNSTMQGVSGIVKERISRAADGLANGERPMLLFPEGTTSNGRFLLPFKSGAFLAGAPVQPVVLKYNEGRVSPAWESIPALKHIWLMLCIPFHSVTALELPVYRPSEEEIANPLLFAMNVRKQMMQLGGLKPSVSCLADKREFHDILKGGSPVVVKKMN